MNITRYKVHTVVPADERRPWGTMVPAKHGSYVRYEDYVRLRSIIEQANDLLYAQGAPLGSENYFSIRTLLCDGLEPDRVKA